MRRTLMLLLPVLFGFCLSATMLSAQKPVQIRLGYFQGGDHPVHSLLREEFTRQLINMTPADTEFVFAPQGYASASWNRDSSKFYAQRLTNTPGLDIIIAVGPWVVEDLLEAGETRPIVGFRQLDPYGTGLIDTTTGRPIAKNLTVQDMPAKIEDDIAVLHRLVPFERLGVMFFASNPEEREAVMERINNVAGQLGAEVFVGLGENRAGTYAYFNAYSNLDKPVDVVYLGPLWGMDIVKIKEFLTMLSRDGVPAFTWEGKFLTSRGALGTNYAYGVVSEARYQVLKTLAIARGETPADLEVTYRGGSALALNAKTIDNCNLEIPSEALLSAEVFPAPTENAQWFSLVEALNRASTTNPGYLATYDAIEAASQAARREAAEYWPHLSVEGVAGYRDDHTLNNTVEPIDNEHYRASFVLEQKIFSLETLRNKRIAAKQKQIEELDQSQAQLDLDLAVTAAYLNDLRAREALGAERRFRELIERSLELAAARWHLQGTGEAAMIRWQSERQQSIVRLLEAENAANVSRLMLSLLINLPLETPVALDTAVASTKKLAVDYELLSPLSVKPKARRNLQSFLVNAAQSNSPALATSDVNIDLARARLNKNQARYWPSLDLRAAFNLVDGIDDGIGVIEEKHDTWSVIGRLNFPLFSGGSRYREKARLKATISEMEFKRDAESLNLMGDVRSAVGRLVTRISTLPRNTNARDLAMHSLTLVLHDYDGGKADIGDVIEAYRSAREYELAEIESRYDYFMAMARLVHDVGWSASANFRTFYDEFHLGTRKLLGP